MPGLVPGIQGNPLMRLPPWIAGTSPAMTGEKVYASFPISPGSSPKCEKTPAAAKSSTGFLR